MRKGANNCAVGGLVGFGFWVVGWFEFAAAACYRLVSSGPVLPLSASVRSLCAIKLSILVSSLSQRLSRFDFCFDFTFVAVLFMGERE
ncbi:hypothetical protein BZA77DRAFT_315224 [Pyronema omphalodes]|nr:hypothetical protein BZA77DRAFT_315224 [Pyronema omphalodes]